jgi:hypothetical protein
MLEGEWQCLHIWIHTSAAVWEREKEKEKEKKKKRRGPQGFDGFDGSTGRTFHTPGSGVQSPG